MLEPGFFIELHNKDLRIGREIHSEKLGESIDYDTAYPLNALSEKLYIECQEQYGPKVGSSFPAKAVQDRVGADLSAPGYDNWGYTIQKVPSGSLGVVHKNCPVADK